MVKRNYRSAVGVLLAILLVSTSLQAQGRITTPKEQFGFNIGDDYVLVNYTDYEKYIRKLDQESDRMTLQVIGKSEEGRPMYLAVITSPENHKKLDRYKQITKQLSLAEGLTDVQARALAQEGKTIVWIDGGLHATEVLGAQQLIEMHYQMLSRNDPETMRLLNDTIILLCLVNPDGMELVSNWYMRNPDPKMRSTAGVPELYNKYAGHDDNRDFFMVNLSESDAINRVLYRNFFPQIMYNHHQTGPAGTIMFSPPFRDPFNYNFDPLVVSELDEVSAAIHSRMIEEGKPGVTMRTGANYSTWYNGGLRTTTYFHNMVGILTETIGSPTPIEVPLIFRNQLPRNDLPFPVPPQVWRFRQSIDYSITANRAILDVGSRNRERYLYNMYVKAKNSIERGNRDSWTITPKRLAAVEAAALAERQGQRGAAPAGQRGGGGRGSYTGSDAQKYWKMVQSPENRDPRGYVLPSDQPDFLTAVKFLNTLIKNGVAIHRATAAFTVAGKSYPAGSYVVKTAQAYRPHILDMFEPQDHPDDFAYPGAPPTPPYDNTGWTLAFEMGVKFDRILDGFECPCQKLPVEELKPPAGRVTTVSNAAGYLLSHDANDAFLAINRLVAANENVYSVKNSFTANGKTYPAGTHFIAAKATTLPMLQKLSAEVGLNFEATAAKPVGEALMLRQMKVGLVDRYGGSMPSGWIRQQLERFSFSFEQVFPPMLDAGNLAQKYDVLIFPDDALQGGGAGDLTNVPQKFAERIGSFTDARTLPQVKKFIEDGGTVLLIGGATSLAYRLGVPVTNALVETDGRPLPQTKFYIPGSILQAKVDNTISLAWGMPPRADFFFDSSPSFKLKPEAAAAGVKGIVVFDLESPLRSGWGFGQNFLKDSFAVVEAPLGKGRVYLFGPEIMFRGQPHGTFKFMFNGIYYGRTESVNLSQQ